MWRAVAALVACRRRFRHPRAGTARSTAVLARAADYVADYRNSSSALSPRSTTGRTCQTTTRAGRPRQPAVPRAAIRRPAGEAGRRRSAGCSSATSSRWTASRSAIVTSASTSCSSTPNDGCAHAGRDHSERERALEHRPVAAHHQHADPGAAVFRRCPAAPSRARAAKVEQSRSDSTGSPRRGESG